MLPVERKVQCVLRIAKFESVTHVRREYRRVFNEEPPHENNIRRWDKQLKETGRLLDKKRSGRPSVSDESVEAIRTNFLRSPRKSVRKCARELGLPKTTVHRVLKEVCVLLATSFSYCMQSGQAILAKDRILLQICSVRLTMTSCS
jgi:transposase